MAEAFVAFILLCITWGSLFWLLRSVSMGIKNAIATQEMFDEMMSTWKKVSWILRSAQYDALAQQIDDAVNSVIDYVNVNEKHPTVEQLGNMHSNLLTLIINANLDKERIEEVNKVVRLNS